MPEEIDKTDLVRLLDVVLIGPLMVFASGKIPQPASGLLFLSGIGTILYNGYNLEIKRRQNIVFLPQQKVM